MVDAVRARTVDDIFELGHGMVSATPPADEEWYKCLLTITNILTVSFSHILLEKGCFVLLFQFKYQHLPLNFHRFIAQNYICFIFFFKLFLFKCFFLNLNAHRTIGFVLWFGDSFQGSSSIKLLQGLHSITLLHDTGLSLVSLCLRNRSILQQCILKKYLRVTSTVSASYVFI